MRRNSEMMEKRHKEAIRELSEAAIAFDRARQKCKCCCESCNISHYQAPKNFSRHFRTAAYATAILYHEGKERLIELENEGIIHPSTISGSSLSTAAQCLEFYFKDGDRTFTTDQYEQLMRTCDSAEKMLER